MRPSQIIRSAMRRTIVPLATPAILLIRTDLILQALPR